MILLGGEAYDRKLNPSTGGYIYRYVQGHAIITYDTILILCYCQRWKDFPPLCSICVEGEWMKIHMETIRSQTSEVMLLVIRKNHPAPPQVKYSSCSTGVTLLYNSKQSSHVPLALKSHRWGSALLESQSCYFRKYSFGIKPQPRLQKRSTRNRKIKKTNYVEVICFKTLLTSLH